VPILDAMLKEQQEQGINWTPSKVLETPASPWAPRYSLQWSGNNRLRHSIIPRGREGFANFLLSTPKAFAAYDHDAVAWPQVIRLLGLEINKEESVYYWCAVKQKA
jgi:hypothetical protein